MKTNSLWETKILLSGAPLFTQEVWRAMLRIPKGKVATYRTIAKWAGSPNASRAVGNACNQNPFAPDVPCHRIVSSSGGVGGYAQGIRKKIALLKKEGVVVRGNKIVHFEKVAVE